MEFIYNENGKSMVLSLRVHEFDRLINRIYDTASGVLLGICRYLNDFISMITVDRTKNTFLSFGLLGLELSIPTIRCRSISGLSDNKQLNLDFYMANSDRTFLLQTAVEIATIIYSRFNNYQQYLISFSNERLQFSWIRFTTKEINEVTTRQKESTEVLMEVVG